MPWSWAIAADFQLFIFIPLWVVIFKKSRTIGISLITLLFIVGTVLVSLIVYKFDLTAGAYTLENWYMYGMYLNKPYCKL
jgi:hypothetical protein